MAQFLRTATPMADWRSFKFTHIIAGLTMAEGQLYRIQETIGVLFLDIQYTAAGCKKAKTIVAGDEGVLFYHAEKIMVDKEAAAIFLPGDKVFWHGIQGGAVSKVKPSGGYWIGIAVAAAGVGDTDVKIDLKGDKATMTEPI